MQQQKAAAKRISTVRRAEVKAFSAFPLFENTLFRLTDLRKKVSGGARVWLVRLDKLKVDKSLIYRENRLFFDSKKLFQPYWSAYRMWDDKLFDEEMMRLKSNSKAGVLRELRCWVRRMKTGDIVLATEQTNQLVAVGIIQSHPQPYTGDAFSSFREVQWLKILAETPYLLPERGSVQPVARFRGSALRVLQDVFEKK